MNRVNLLQIKLRTKDKLEGGTPLHWAALEGHAEICKILLDNHVEKNPRTNDGRTPLNIAASKGHFKVCQVLLQNNVDKIPRDNDGDTPLHLG